MNENEKIIVAVKKFLEVNGINVKTKTGFRQELCFVSGYLTALIPDVFNISEDMKALFGFVSLIHGAGRSLSTL
jgi:hypothetical protein